MEPKIDWDEVVALNPKGYVELNDGKHVVHGPLESIEINDADFVVIKLKWSARMVLGQHGVPVNFEWEAVPENPPIVFPNLILPFVLGGLRRAKHDLVGLSRRCSNLDASERACFQGTPVPPSPGRGGGGVRHATTSSH